MKKINFVLIILLAVSTFCAVHLPLARAEEIKTAIGKIESVKRFYKSSPPKWEHAMLTVVADSGKKTVVYTVKATIVTDISGKDLCAGGYFGVFRLKEGERVEVKYSTARKDHNEAISIRCVPADYIQQPGMSATQETSSGTPADTFGTNTFTGKIESSSSIFGLPSKRKLVIVSDSGDRLTVFVSKEVAIRDMRAAPTRIGKRAEVKYLTEENGGNNAISFQYLD